MLSNYWFNIMCACHTEVLFSTNIALNVLLLSLFFISYCFICLLFIVFFIFLLMLLYFLQPTLLLRRCKFPHREANKGLSHLLWCASSSVELCICTRCTVCYCAVICFNNDLLKPPQMWANAGTVHHIVTFRFLINYYCYYYLFFIWKKRTFTVQMRLFWMSYLSAQAKWSKNHIY